MVVNSFYACIRITKNALLSQRHHSTQAHACHVICHRPTSPACRSDPIITRTASAELLGTFELLHLELLRGGLHPDGSRQDAANASAAAASAAAAAARKPRRFPAGGAEDKDMQASRLHSRRLTTLPSGRALSRPNRSMKLCSSFEIPTPPSDPASALFYRAPSVSARISSVRVRSEPYPTAYNDAETHTLAERQVPETLPACSRRPNPCLSTSPARTRRISCGAVSVQGALSIL